MALELHHVREGPPDAPQEQSTLIARPLAALEPTITSKSLPAAHIAQMISMSSTGYSPELLQA